MAWLPSERLATSVRAEALAGSRPRARTSSWSSGARLPDVVALSSPSIQTSTPAGSVTKNTLASTRTSGTSRFCVSRAVMATWRVSVWYPGRATSTV